MLTDSQTTILAKLDKEIDTLNQKLRDNENRPSSSGIYSLHIVYKEFNEIKNMGNNNDFIHLAYEKEKELLIAINSVCNHPLSNNHIHKNYHSHIVQLEKNILDYELCHQKEKSNKINKL